MKGCNPITNPVYVQLSLCRAPPNIAGHKQLGSLPWSSDLFLFNKTTRMLCFTFGFLAGKGLRMAIIGKECNFMLSELCKWLPFKMVCVESLDLATDILGSRF